MEEKIARNSANALGYWLKDYQLATITSFLKGEDVLAVLPTGYGKSLCFLSLPDALDALYNKEHGHCLVIVISPLKALMENQVRNLAFICHKDFYFNVCACSSSPACKKDYHQYVFMIPWIMK